MKRIATIGLIAAGLPALMGAAPAFAAVQDAGGESVAGQLARLERMLADQRAQIDRQDALIAAQQGEIEALRARMGVADLLAGERGRGLDLAQTPTGQPIVTSPSVLPDTPVGEAPPEPEAETRVAVQAVPEGQGVLTPAGRLVFDPSVEYLRSSTNRLVFRGIELIPGIQIGLIEATDADRDTVVGTLAARYGLTGRLEAEIRVPYLYRRDRIEVVQQRDEGIVRQIELQEHGIGDVEFGLRYQLNRPRGQRPIWVAQLRVKSDTGKSPFSVGFDEFGVATGLATGSGFWAVQPGVSFLLPSDPAVIYGGLSYLYHIPRDINRTVGDAFIGRVDPGDAVSANLGFGFALNPRFSFSLGYRHSYIVPTVTEIGDTVQRSNYLQVGAFAFGMSYRVTERETVNIGFAFGVTADSPDVSIALRMPFAFNLR